MESVNDTKENQNVSSDVLTSKERYLYGSGNLAANLLIGTAAQFITYFYTEQVGISAAVAGTILFLARLFDGATDIGMGIVVDKTDSKYGKARPWLLWMAIPYGLAIVLLFSSPNFGETGRIVYAFLTYLFAVGFIYTAVTVPYNSMIGTMTMDPEERGVLSTSRALFGQFGAWFVSVTVLPLVALYGGGSNGWLFMGVTFAVMGAGLWIFTFKISKERVSHQIMGGEEAKVPLKEGIPLLFKNKYWLLAVGVLLIAYINQGIAGIQPYYAEHIFGNPNLVGLMQTARTVPIVLATFGVGFMMRVISKRNLVIIGAAITVFGSLIMTINPQSLYVVLTGIAVRAVGNAPLVISVYAMIGDAVDYGEAKGGLRVEGLSYSAATFGEKVGLGFGGMILGVLLGASGYVGGQSVQTDSALQSIEMIFIYVPIIADTIAIFMMYWYDLDKKHAEVVEELEEKKD